MNLLRCRWAENDSSSGFNMNDLDIEIHIFVHEIQEHVHSDIDHN